MCEITEKRIFEEKVYLAKEALKKNELTFEQISTILFIEAHASLGCLSEVSGQKKLKKL